MTTEIYERVVGDTGPDIIKVLPGAGTLTGTVKAYLYRRRETTTALTAVVSNPATRTITTDIGGWLPTVRSGDWKIKWRVTTAEKQTWEPGRPDVVRVAKNPAL